MGREGRNRAREKWERKTRKKSEIKITNSRIRTIKRTGEDKKMRNKTKEEKR